MQLCRDLEKQPIEDASALWSEDVSPFRTVARLKAGLQIAFHPRITWNLNDRPRFSPWTGLAAHEPLSEISRARRGTYKLSADYRQEFNGCPIYQPRRLSDLPFPDKESVRSHLPRRTMPEGPMPGRQGLMSIRPRTLVAVGIAALGTALYAYRSRSDDRV